MTPRSAHDGPRERPVLFSGSMVRAILGGTKTQTRRVVHSSASIPVVGCNVDSFVVTSGGLAALASPWRIGGRLWVRETWYCDDYRAAGAGIHLADELGEDRASFLSMMYYRADSPRTGSLGEQMELAESEGRPWRPSIFMPRWASRLTLDVVSVRVERVQAISEADARAEGIPWSLADALAVGNGGTDTAVSRYAVLWDSINGKRSGASWAANPWVWVIEFRRTT